MDASDSSKKRKDFTPKKEKEFEQIKKQVTGRPGSQRGNDSDHENQEGKLGTNFPKRNLFSIAKVSQESDQEATDQIQNSPDEDLEIIFVKEVKSTCDTTCDKKRRVKLGKEADDEETAFLKDAKNPFDDASFPFVHRKIKNEDLSEDDDDISRDEEVEICTYPRSEPISQGQKSIYRENEQHLNKDTGDESSSDADANVDFYQGRKELPIFSEDPPSSINDIFRICLLKDVPKEKLVSEKPLRVTSNATFVVDPRKINLKHPFDLESDDVSGAYEKKEQTRFYEVDPIENETNFRLSCNLHVRRNEEGDVVSGYHNFREGSLKWVKTEADMSKTYAVIRKRGVHKKTREKYDVQFVRYIIYIMPLDEYNRVNRFLKTMKTYNLSDSYIIVSYQLDSDEEISIEPTKHGNAKK